MKLLSYRHDRRDHGGDHEDPAGAGVSEVRLDRVPRLPARCRLSP